jgi:hypothetical protein
MTLFSLVDYNGQFDLEEIQIFQVAALRQHWMSSLPSVSPLVFEDPQKNLVTVTRPLGRRPSG